MTQVGQYYRTPLLQRRLVRPEPAPICRVLTEADSGGCHNVEWVVFDPAHGFHPERIHTDYLKESVTLYELALALLAS